MDVQNLFRCCLTLVSPMVNTKIVYRVKFKKKLDLKNPQTFNEKLLWLKFNKYRNNVLVKKCADKYLVREYVKECGCEEILNPLLEIYDNPKDVDWGALPNSFALKWNFGCGLNIIVPDKQNIDFTQTTKKLCKMMKKNFYLPYSEFQYKNVTKKLLIEKYLSDGNGLLPLDYKVYCFNGKPYCVMLCVGRGNKEENLKFYFFDTEWNFLRINKSGMEAPDGFTIEKPEGMDEVFRYAAILCKPFDFVRADFYIVNGKPIFGELTFTPAGAMDNNIPVSMDENFGKRLLIKEIEG